MSSILLVFFLLPFSTAVLADLLGSPVFNLMMSALLHAYQLTCCILNPWVITIKRTFHLMFSLPSLSLAQSVFLQVGPYFWNVFVSLSFLNSVTHIASPLVVLPASF